MLKLYTHGLFLSGKIEVLLRKLIRGERTSYKLEALHRWGGGAHKREREGGWSETIRVVDLEEREAYFLLFH